MHLKAELQSKEAKTDRTAKRNRQVHSHGGRFPDHSQNN